MCHIWGWEGHHPNSIYTYIYVYIYIYIYSLRLRLNMCHFEYDIFKYIFMNETILISITISFKFIHKDAINNIPVLVQITAWCRPGDKPLSESMMIILLTYMRHSASMILTEQGYGGTTEEGNCSYLLPLSHREGVTTSSLLDPPPRYPWGKHGSHICHKFLLDRS